MKAKFFSMVFAGVVLAATAIPMFAHHSFSAEFDGSKRISLTGVITRVNWQNPHVYFYIDVKDATSGKVTNYACEMGSPNGLLGGGLTRNALRVGLVVSTNGAVAKDGSAKINAAGITVDGKDYKTASSEGYNP